MLPSRVIIDPNVFISALIAKRDSVAVAAAKAVATDKLILVACPHLLAELTEVARREKFRKYFSIERAELLVAALELKAEMWPNPPAGTRVCADPGDDYLFALSKAANVQIVVTGDRKVQAVRVPSVDILTPTALMDRLNELTAIPCQRGFPSSLL